MLALEGIAKRARRWRRRRERDDPSGIICMPSKRQLLMMADILFIVFAGIRVCACLGCLVYMFCWCFGFRRGYIL